MNKRLGLGYTVPRELANNIKSFKCLIINTYRAKQLLSGEKGYESTSFCNHSAVTIDINTNMFNCENCGNSIRVEDYELLKEGKFDIKDQPYDCGNPDEVYLFVNPAHSLPREDEKGYLVVDKDEYTTGYFKSMPKNNCESDDLSDLGNIYKHENLTEKSELTPKKNCDLSKLTPRSENQPEESLIPDWKHSNCRNSVRDIIFSNTKINDKDHLMLGTKYKSINDLIMSPQITEFYSKDNFDSIGVKYEIDGRENIIHLVVTFNDGTDDTTIGYLYGVDYDCGLIMMGEVDKQISSKSEKKYYGVQQNNKRLKSFLFSSTEINDSDSSAAKLNSLNDLFELDYIRDYCSTTNFLQIGVKYGTDINDTKLYLIVQYRDLTEDVIGFLYDMSYHNTGLIKMGKIEEKPDFTLKLSEKHYRHSPKYKIDSVGDLIKLCRDRNYLNSEYYSINNFQIQKTSDNTKFNLFGSIESEKNHVGTFKKIGEIIGLNIGQVNKLINGNNLVRISMEY